MADLSETAPRRPGGDLPSGVVAGAKLATATSRAVRASDAVSTILADYTRTKALYDAAIAEKRPSTLGPELARLAKAHRNACEREREAWRRLGQLRMEERE